MEIKQGGSKHNLNIGDLQRGEQLSSEMIETLGKKDRRCLRFGKEKKNKRKGAEGGKDLVHGVEISTCKEEESRRRDTILRRL